MDVGATSILVADVRRRRISQITRDGRAQPSVERRENRFADLGIVRQHVPIAEAEHRPARGRSCKRPARDRSRNRRADCRPVRRPAAFAGRRNQRKRGRAETAGRIYGRRASGPSIRSRGSLRRHCRCVGAFAPCRSRPPPCGFGLQPASRPPPGPTSPTGTGWSTSAEAGADTPSPSRLRRATSPPLRDRLRGRGGPKGR